MRRAAVILLVMVLMPSMASAAWYRCAFDGMTRSACCCPMQPGQRHKAPPPESSVRAGCCCTITQIASRTPSAEAQAQAPAPDTPHPTTAAIPAAAVAPHAPHAPLRGAVLGRPRAQGDPPATLFARRCSLLL